MKERPLEPVAATQTFARSHGTFGTERVAGPSDHACFGYTSGSERARIAGAWLADGLAIGQRAMYVADASAAALLDELRETMTGAADAVASGALVVVSSEDVYDLTVPIDDGSQLAAYSSMVEGALADGYLGMRVAADITPLVDAPTRRPAHLRWEQAADRYIADHPLAPLCLFDAARLEGLDAILCAHPLQGPVPASFAVVGRGASEAALSGDVDTFASDTLAAVLAAAPDDDRVLDLSELAFMDGRAAWILHEHLARRRAAGRPTSLRDPPRSLRRIWDVCDFDSSLLGG